MLMGAFSIIDMTRFISASSRSFSVTTDQLAIDPTRSPVAS